MGHKVFLDANVILDYTLKRAIGYHASKIILEKIINGEIQGYTSSVSIHIVSHILKKELNPAITRKIVVALLNDILVVDSPREVIVQAMSAGWSDIEDATLYYTALHHHMNILVSRDKAFIKKALPSLPIVLPEVFLKSL